MDIQRTDHGTPGLRPPGEHPRGSGKTTASGRSAFEVTISDRGVEVADRGAALDRSGATPSARLRDESVAGANRVAHPPERQDLVAAADSKALAESSGAAASTPPGPGRTQSEAQEEGRVAAVYDTRGRMARILDSAPGRLLDLTA